MKLCSSKRGCKKMNYLPFLSWMPGIFVAILPKCPFCIMAYSGAVTLCSGRTLYPNSGSNAAYITIAVSVFILFMIYRNHRGKRTVVSLFLCSIAICLLLVSQLILMNSIFYTVASILLLFGIWYNGSFLYCYNKVVQFLSTHFLNTNKQNL